MKNCRGQASILIAIIFQVLFIFFAMVINVGLLVNDKINLQNSVDLAAYYGAMKQAEVLNFMGHVNFQIHSIYKLFNFRIWALGNAGRSKWKQNHDLGDHQAVWNDAYPGPIVCVSHNMWYDYAQKAPQGNLCNQANKYVPNLHQVTLSEIPVASAFFPLAAVFASQSARNSTLFNADFQDGGQAAYAISLRFLASYKIEVAKKRLAMQSLQKLLTGVGAGSPQAGAAVGAGDFSDISGASVKQTITSIIQKNLTSANLAGLSDVEVGNSLYQQPFLVPIEVRTFITYEDLTNGTQAATGTPEPISQTPKAGAGGIDLAAAQLFFNPDYSGSFPPASASEFAQESQPNHTFNSLIGFEKDPWTLAYVKVTATTTPKMLFSPFLSSDNKTVTLKAEAYAMPFGGHIGPWYMDGWPAGSASSQGGNPVDGLLPPRYPDGYNNTAIPPNFSRYPGDTLGMQSALAENVALGAWYSNMPQGVSNQYGSIDFNPDDSASDPLVEDSTNPQAQVRLEEIGAVAPNLFDAAYFPISSTFDADYDQNTYGGNFAFTQVCQNHCNDLGSFGSPVTPFPVLAQVGTGQQTMQGEWWLITSAQEGSGRNDLNTGWTEEGTDLYSKAPTMPGKDRPNGGRVGYSVKIVSKEFLNSGQLPFGGSAGTGPLKNPPQTMFGD